MTKIIKNNNSSIWKLKKTKNKGFTNDNVKKYWVKKISEFYMYNKTWSKYLAGRYDKISKWSHLLHFKNSQITSIKFYFTF